MMMIVKVEQYCDKYATETISMILTIQRDEFKLPITIEDQPDLSSIREFYFKGNGTFLVAIINQKVIGTFGLIDIGDNLGALRKMFVNKEYRGNKYNVAKLLLESMLEWACTKKYHALYLGTTTLFKAAHRFYDKNGFEQIGKTALPLSFPIMKVDTIFYKKQLNF